MNIKQITLLSILSFCVVRGQDNVELTADAQVYIQCLKDFGRSEKILSDNTCEQKLLPKYMRECGISPFSRSDNMTLQQQGCIQLKYRAMKVNIVSAEIRKELQKANDVALGNRIKQ